MAIHRLDETVAQLSISVVKLRASGSSSANRMVSSFPRGITAEAAWLSVTWSVE